MIQSFQFIVHRSSFPLQPTECFLRERLGFLLADGVGVCAAETEADEAVAFQDVERAAHATVDPVSLVAETCDALRRCTFLFFLAAMAAACFVFILVFFFFLFFFFVAFGGAR